MRKRLVIIVLVILSVALVFSVSMVIKGYLNYREGDTSYSKAMEIAGIADIEQIPYKSPLMASPVETDNASTSSDTAVNSELSTATGDPGEQAVQMTFEEVMLSVDLDALRQYNPDVVAWIGIPGTAISYPVLQGTDNSYYLNKTWYKTQSSVGSIFLEHTADPALTDFNTIIYGHKVGNGTMFNGLLNYNNDRYWKTHPEIYILTDDGLLCYDIFSAYETDTDALAYGIEFVNDSAKTKFINSALENSVINTGIEPSAEDRILTLSTCSTMFASSKRWVVHAVLNTEKCTYFD